MASRIPGGGGLSAALLMAQASGSKAGEASGSRDGLPEFQAADAFDGPRKGMCFKLGDRGLGYYPDPFQTLIAEVRPKLPETWRNSALREELLKVDPKLGAGISLEHSDFGFAVESIEDAPGQQLRPNDVIVAIEGRILAGLSGPQMQASFIKRRANGARLTVASLFDVKEMSTRDPNIMECWDASNQCTYYFHKKTGKSGWTVAELQTGTSSTSGAASAAPEGGGVAPPVDLSEFLLHGFNAPKKEAPKQKVKKRKNPQDDGKDESDLARDEKQRWDDWNAGGKGGYTEQFLAKYKNCTSWVSKPKEDKRLKGSVGPGNGMEYMAAWTGSKNSFN